MMTTELNFQKKAMWFEAFAYRSFLSLSDEVVGVGGILHGCVQLRIQLSSKLNEKSTGLFSKPLCLLSGRAFRSLHRLRSLLALLQQHLERPENSGLNGSRTLTSAMPVQCSTSRSAIRPVYLIQKWRLFYFCSSIVQISLPSRTLDQEFFSISHMTKRLGRLISIRTKE